MLSTIQTRSINVLQYIVDTLESYDDNAERERVFGRAEVADSDDEPTFQDQIVEMGADVLDISLH